METAIRQSLADPVTKELATWGDFQLGGISGETEELRVWLLEPCEAQRFHILKILPHILELKHKPVPSALTP